jgi:hypothetical protein
VFAPPRLAFLVVGFPFSSLALSPRGRGRVRTRALGLLSRGRTGGWGLASRRGCAGRAGSFTLLLIFLLVFFFLSTLVVLVLVVSVFFVVAAFLDLVA